MSFSPLFAILFLVFPMHSTALVVVTSARAYSPNYGPKRTLRRTAADAAQGEVVVIIPFTSDAPRSRCSVGKTPSSSRRQRHLALLLHSKRCFCCRTFKKALKLASKCIDQNFLSVPCCKGDARMTNVTLSKVKSVVIRFPQSRQVTLEVKLLTFDWPPLVSNRKRTRVSWELRLIRVVSRGRMLFKKTHC